MRCPRCEEETSGPVPAFCARCGAPLRLADEAPPRPLDLPIVMDRRGGGERRAPSPEASPLGRALSAGGAAHAVAGAGELAAVERSHWDLGAVVAAARAEPLALGEDAPRDERAPGAPAAAERADDGELLVEVDALEIRLRRPATWRRVGAGALDALPFAVAGLALSRSLLRAAAAGLPAPATGLDGLLDLAVRERAIVVSVAATVALALAVYATLAHALAGATLGKRLLGLAVVGPDGRRPSLGRSAARAALAVLSAALLGLGFHLALFTRSGRALHDLVARTWVVEAP